MSKWFEIVFFRRLYTSIAKCTWQKHNHQTNSREVFGEAHECLFVQYCHIKKSDRVVFLSLESNGS